MKTFVRCTLLVALVAPTGLLRAESPSSATARAKAIAPFIDEQTVAVVHVDLTRIEIDPILDKLVELVPAAQQDIETRRGVDKRALAGFLEAGATEFYPVFSLPDLPEHGPFLVVPRTSQLDLEAFRAVFPRSEAEFAAAPAPRGKVVIEPVGAVVSRTIESL